MSYVRMKPGFFGRGEGHRLGGHHRGRGMHPCAIGSKMPEFLVNWLDRLPAGQLLALFCVFFLGVAWFGIAAVHPHLRRHLHGDEPSNEVIIFSAANFGLV